MSQRRSDDDQGTKYIVGKRMTEEEFEENMKAIAERDKEYLAKLNAPIDLEFLRKNVLCEEHGVRKLVCGCK